MCLRTLPPISLAISDRFVILGKGAESLTALFLIKAWMHLLPGSCTCPASFVESLQNNIGKIIFHVHVYVLDYSTILINCMLKYCCLLLFLLHRVCSAAMQLFLRYLLYKMTYVEIYIYWKDAYLIFFSRHAQVLSSWHA